MQASRGIRSVISSDNLVNGGLDFESDLRFRLYSESFEDEAVMKSPPEPLTPIVRYSGLTSFMQLDSVQCPPLQLDALDMETIKK